MGDIPEVSKKRDYKNQIGVQSGGKEEIEPTGLVISEKK